MNPQLREFFAAAALPEVMSLHARPFNASALKSIAEQSYAVADAMLVAYRPQVVAETNKVVQAIISNLEALLDVGPDGKWAGPERVIQALELARTLPRVVEVPDASR